MRQYIMQSNMAESGSSMTHRLPLRNMIKEAYDILLKNAENKRDGYLKKKRRKR